MTKNELGIWQKLTSESETNLEARIKFDNLINNKIASQSLISSVPESTVSNITHLKDKLYFNLKKRNNNK